MSVADLEHQVEQLNEVVTGQSKLVELLKKQVQRQSNVLETIELVASRPATPRRRTIILNHGQLPPFCRVNAALRTLGNAAFRRQKSAQLDFLRQFANLVP